MTAKTTDFSGTLFYNPAGPGFSADIRATVTADTVSRPALTIYAEPGYTGLPSEGTFSFSYWYSNGSGPLAQIFHYAFGGVDGVITYANVLGDQNYGIRAVDDIFITLTDPFFMSGLYGTVVLKVGTIGNTGDEGNYQKFDVVSWGIESLGGLNHLETSSNTCSVTLNGDTKHYRIESDNSQVQIDSLPEHAHEPLSLANGALYWRVENLQNLTTNRFLDVSGQLFIANNRSSFNVHVDANNTTATGPQTYDVIVSKTVTSTALSTATGNVVNDTSQDPIGLMMDLDPMNYTTGSSISDASGYSHPGTLIGAPTFTTGGTNGSGNYFTLNGTSQYITVPSLLTSAYASVTMSLWFNSSTGVGSLITKELSYKMRLNGGGVPAVLASSTGTGWQYNSTNVLDTVSNDAWHHFAVSIGPDFVDWYLDGTRIQHEAGMGVDIHSSTRGVQIGGYDSNVPSELFTGKIGPARLYNYALTSQEVTTYYNATKDRYQPAPGSLPVSAGIYLEVGGTTSDWALGTTWTMEWWSKASIPSTEGRLMGVLGQNTGNSGIDIFQQRGKLYLGKSEYTDLGAEPTPGVWTHVAVVSNAGTVKVYYNGTSVYGPTAVGYNLTNSTDKLYVGIRSQGNNPISQQSFSGQLTGIRITNTAVYTGTFNPLTVALPPTKVTGTKLLINPTVIPAIDDASDSAHGVGGIGQVSKYYPPSVQLTSGTSLSFSGSGQDVQVTGTRTDWALGTTWTVEWWEKITVGTSGFCGVMSQDSNDGGNPQPYTGPLGFDIYHAGGVIAMYNNRWSFTEPTQGVWNHIAIQNNNGTVTPYINGVATGINQSSPTLGLTNSTNDLVIGLRSADGASPGYSQWFVGQIANIRISNVARYTVTFTPPTTVVVDANTVLALDGSTNAMLDDVSASNHTITNNGTTVVIAGSSYSRSFGTQGINPLTTTIFPAPVFPISVIGWTMTGPGITQTTTVTGQTNFGSQTSIDYTPAFVYSPGTYVFTPP